MVESSDAATIVEATQTQSHENKLQVEDEGNSVPDNDAGRLDDDEGLMDTIVKISKSGDLSPHQVDSLKDKKGRSNLPLQVQIWSSKGKSVSFNQW